MIICGYAGIGKSSVANAVEGIIDLDSSIFRVGHENGERFDNWEDYYCRTAVALSKQGFVVFVSTHPEVLTWLKENTFEPVFCIFPAEHLKEDWIERLESRYEKSGIEKDERALISTRDNFDEHIKLLRNSGFAGIAIQNARVYQLGKLVEHLIEFMDGIPSQFRLNS